ncbi:MAG TPA: hypothetical protein VK738_06290 [Terriglobales bacterium]|jgi:hypothetical protein|nr:hypothetical protein [Terriglobales bacterium]
MRLSSFCLLLLGIPLLLAANLPDAKPQAASGMNAQVTPGLPSGLKITVRNTFAGMPSEQTTYIQGDRRRREYRNAQGSPRSDGSMDMSYGPHLVAITRCDLGQAFELNLDKNEYEAMAYPPKPLRLSKAEMDAMQQRTPQVAKAGNATLRIETTTVDTGERKQIFGHTARHVMITSRSVPLAGSKATAYESASDGWYIDLDTRISCDMKWPEGKRGFSYLSAGNAPGEKIEFVSHGDPETGAPVDLKFTSSQTIVLPDGTTQTHTSISQTQVTSLEQRPLDPALFAVPTGFRQVEQIERNPRPNFAAQLSMAWEEFKAGVAHLFE